MIVFPQKNDARPKKFKSKKMDPVIHFSKILKAESRSLRTDRLTLIFFCAGVFSTAFDIFQNPYNYL